MQRAWGIAALGLTGLALALWSNIPFSRFMFDASKLEYGRPAVPVAPGRPHAAMVRHNCLTAYVATAYFYEQHPKGNVYERTQKGAPILTDQALGGLLRDEPPPHNPPMFAVLMRPVMAGLEPVQFLQARSRWYVIELILVARLDVAGRVVDAQLVARGLGRHAVHPAFSAVVHEYADGSDPDLDGRASRASRWYVRDRTPRRFAGKDLMPSAMPIHLVIPISGQGTRYRAAGFTDPKPLIPVSARPMIERLEMCASMESSTSTRSSRFCGSVAT